MEMKACKSHKKRKQLHIDCERFTNGNLEEVNLQVRVRGFVELVKIYMMTRLFRIDKCGKTI